MKEENLLHKGFTSEGEDQLDNGFNDIPDEIIESNYSFETLESIENEEEESTLTTQKDCTILWWNGRYQKPNIKITDGKTRFVSRHRNVTRIQLRRVPGGGIRYYSSPGTHRIPNGEYVLSLWGSTYGYNRISACVEYKV